MWDNMSVANNAQRTMKRMQGRWGEGRRGEGEQQPEEVYGDGSLIAISARRAKPASRAISGAREAKKQKQDVGINK